MFGFFERLIDPFPSHPAEQPPATIYRFCRFYTKGVERWLLVMAVLVALKAVSEALLFGVMGKLVDWLAFSDPNVFLQESWLTLVILSVGILLVLPALAVLHSLVVNQTLMVNLPMSVLWLSHRSVLNESFSFFENELSGRISGKVLQTADAVREVVMKSIDVVLFVTIYIGTTLLIIANADLRLCIPLLVWVVLFAGVHKFFMPRMKQTAMRQADKGTSMVGQIIDSYSNIVTLKLFSHAGREAEYAQKSMADCLNERYPFMRQTTWLNASLWTINMLLVFSTAALGLYLWLVASITPGAIAVAMALALRVNGMSHWILWEIGAIFRNVGVLQDSMETLSIRQSVRDDERATELQVAGGEINFDKIRFSYNADNESKPVFDCLDLKIGAGEKVGLVGHSGAGKSTLVKLLMRFYDTQRGTISIDGQDIRLVKQDSLRAQIGTVTQDTSLLYRTVRENIAFGRPGATEEQLIRAAKQAEAHDFILSLSDADGGSGYDTHVGERGVKLSGGQRQRIAIARVLLKDAPILMLDEATSALDSEVEATIQESLYKLMEGKTVLAIAHRLSTIAAMDRLVVFEDGKIVEQGRHDELLAKNGAYSRLWRRQSGGFLPTD